MSRRIAAVLEVLGVYLAGQLVMSMLVRALGIALVNPLTGLTADVTGSGLLTATRQLFVLLTLQYAGWFLLIIPINWWHRRRRPADYGLTRAGHAWRFLLLAGLATAALAQWPTRSIELVNALHPLGGTVPWRQAIFDMPWARWEFWLFSAVGSFAFIPVVEELFYRGYCQRRLAEDWGNGPAIVGVACLFTFAHGQYLAPNAYNGAMVASLLVSAIGFGVVFAWTRSLVPSVIAHVVINVPMTALWQALVLAGLVIGAVVAARRGLATLRDTFAGTRPGHAAALGVLGAAYAVLAQRVQAMVFVALAMVAVALVLEGGDQRSRRAP